MINALCQKGIQISILSTKIGLLKNTNLNLNSQDKVQWLTSPIIFRCKTWLTSSAKGSTFVCIRAEYLIGIKQNNPDALGFLQHL